MPSGLGTEAAAGIHDVDADRRNSDARAGDGDRSVDAGGLNSIYDQLFEETNDLLGNARNEKGGARGHERKATGPAPFCRDGHGVGEALTE